MTGATAGGKRGYHHGNLRAALIEVTADLIAARGPQGFTVSEAAKRAGVSPAAVYRHFDGREAMIAALALEGYRIFCDLMEHAYESRAEAPLSAFMATGRAYLAFARRFPGHYVAMFESGISVASDPDFSRAAGRANAILERAAGELGRHIPAERRPPAAMFSAHVWALSHGVVELFARGGPGRRAPYSPEDLLESGIGIYLRGLGLIPPDA